MQVIPGYDRFLIIIGSDIDMQAYVLREEGSLSTPDQKVKQWMNGDERLEYHYPLNNGSENIEMKVAYLGRALGPKARVFKL